MKSKQLLRNLNFTDSYPFTELSYLLTKWGWVLL